ncbi:hypothetical protein ACFYX5_01660 [Streptomyces rubiginosohelvolus]|uniref:hypothetical protein n=1 Tax=Streptomyces rubiginosohelvolus TaxID=67362 RepID=UPI0036A9AD26
MLVTQEEASQKLARTALGIVTTLNDQRMYDSPEIRAVYARVRQLAHLAGDAVDHFIAAEDILLAAQIGLPVETGDGFMTVPTEQQASREALRYFDLVGERLSLGAVDAVAAAELYVTHRCFRGHVPDHRPPALSPAQSSTLRAIAHGEVTISSGRPWLSRDDLRVSISTVRALEGGGLVARTPCPRPLQDERLVLTSAGRRSLAATFARPRHTALATGRPPRRPVTSTARSKAR